MTPNRFIRASLIFTLIFILAAAVYLEARGLHRVPDRSAVHVPDGDIDLGRQAIIAHGCGACHVIPGIRTATGRVGPQLVGLREQSYIAGMLPNQPEHLVNWIQNPQQINPETAMPNLHIPEPEARHIAAYLYNR